MVRRAGLFDWDRRSIRWAVVAVAFALFVGAVAERSVARDIQASDAPVATLAGEPA